MINDDDHRSINTRRKGSDARDSWSEGQKDARGSERGTDSISCHTSLSIISVTSEDPEDSEMRAAVVADSQETAGERAASAISDLLLPAYA